MQDYNLRVADWKEIGGDGEVGFALPMKISDGGILKAKGMQHINSCIRRIVLTAQGSIPGVYSFGGGLSTYVFGVSSPSSFDILEINIKQALEIFEWRINSVEVAIRKGETPEEVKCFVSYKINSTNSLGNVEVKIG